MSEGLSFTSESAPLAFRPTAKRDLMPVEVAEVAAPRGNWILPAVNEVRLGLILSDYSANWHRSRGLLSIDVSAGSLSICEFNQPRYMEMRNPANVALVLLRDEILEQALHDSRQPRVELLERHGLQDQIMRRLMEILLYEKRHGFQSGAFFLDGIAAALASHLIRCYSADTPVMANSVGGMSPSALRRCIALMDARLEGDLRLDELAREAGLKHVALHSEFSREHREDALSIPARPASTKSASLDARSPCFSDRGCQVERLRESASPGSHFPAHYRDDAKRLPRVIVIITLRNETSR